MLLYLRTYEEDRRCDARYFDDPGGGDSHRHVAAARASMMAWRVQRKIEVCKSDLSENIPRLTRLARQKDTRPICKT